MRYRLRTLLILAALGPPLVSLAWHWFAVPNQTLPEPWIGMRDDIFVFPADWADRVREHNEPAGGTPDSATVLSK